MSATDSNDKTHALSEERAAAALASARQAIGRGLDPYGIATTLVAQHQRLAALEAVAKTAKRYLNAGQDEVLHAALAKALEHSDRLDETLRAAIAPLA